MDRQHPGGTEPDVPQEPAPTPGPTYWDRIAAELRAFRESVGSPSYAEVAQRVTAARVAAGATPEAARIARTTVYDAFRDGRKRMDLDLHREIAAALGAERAEVEEWLRRSRLGPATASAPAGEASPPAEARAAEPPTPQPVETPSSDGQPAATPPPGAGWQGALALMVACVALNLLGRDTVTALHLSVHLDMLGTAVVALALGPWRGAAVGLATNLLGALTVGWVSVPFALVNVVGALVWGYGSRRGLGRTLPRFLGLNVAVAVVCSAVAVPILLALYGGSVDHGQDGLVGQLLDHTDPVLAVAVANLTTSLADKLLSGFVALACVAALPAAFRRGRGLVLTEAGVASPAREA